MPLLHYFSCASVEWIPFYHLIHFFHSACHFSWAVTYLCLPSVVLSACLESRWSSFRLSQLYCFSTFLGTCLFYPSSLMCCSHLSESSLFLVALVLCLLQTEPGWQAVSLAWPSKMDFGFGFWIWSPLSPLVLAVSLKCSCESCHLTSASAGYWNHESTWTCRLCAAAPCCSSCCLP